MAFDAGMLHGVLHEITERCGGAKVEKVLQPTRDEVDIVCRGHRLAIHVGSSIPHIALTGLAKDNPAVPPMFCMLLRKHLVGALLTEVRQEGFDRVARLVFAGHDDMGFPTTRTLVVELMGKYNNLILLDGEDKILSAMKYIDFSDSSLRQVLPGLTYTLPPAQAKANPLVTTPEEFHRLYCACSPEKSIARFLADSFSGIAIGNAREIAYRATGLIDAPLGAVSPEALEVAFFAWFQKVKNQEYHPVILMDEEWAPVEYSYQEITYYGEKIKAEVYNSFSDLFDIYFGEKERVERIRQRAADVIRIVSRTEARLERKLALQREEWADSEKGEQYRRLGDLITANLYRIKRGMDAVLATDYSVDPPAEVEVPLDPRLYPAQNAQKMYKLYNKAKTAHEVLGEQIARSEEELAYMQSVRAFLDRAATEADLSEIRDELYRSGYASRMKGYKPQKQVKPRPITYVSQSGYKILCGRNNLQNDLLTFRMAEKGDLWFHAKGVPGSHVILVCGGEEPSEEDYTQAAEIAAFHSQATGDLVAVDYTRVKNVKKPPSAKPGFVIYKTNYTAFVRPKEGELLK